MAKKYGCQVILRRAPPDDRCNRRPTTHHHLDTEHTWWVCADCESRFNLTNPVENQCPPTLFPAGDVPSADAS